MGRYTTIRIRGNDQVLLHVQMGIYSWRGELSALDNGLCLDTFWQPVEVLCCQVLKPNGVRLPVRVTRPSGRTTNMMLIDTQRRTASFHFDGCDLYLPGLPLQPQA